MEPCLKSYKDLKPYHKKDEVCFTRAGYRESRWEKAVKVYTINQESRYLLVQNVPCVQASKELVELFALYGEVEEYQKLDDYPKEEFTEVYWIKYRKIQPARFGKRKLDNRSFFGSQLHVCYAPEFETVNDVREKINERRRVVARKCKENNLATNEDTNQITHSSLQSSTVEKSKTIDKDKNKNRNVINQSLKQPNFNSDPPSFQKPDKSLPYISSSHATLPVEIQNLSTPEVYPGQVTETPTNESYRVFDNAGENQSNKQDEEVLTHFQPKKKRIVWSNFATNYTREPGAWNPYRDHSNTGQMHHDLEPDGPSSSNMSCEGEKQCKEDQPLMKKKKNKDGRKRI